MSEKEFRALVHMAPDVCCTSGCTCDLPKRRTAQEAASVDQLRNFERELRRRDSGFMRITSTNAALGAGTYEARTPAGQTSPRPFTFTGDVITTPAFAAPVSGGGPRKDEEVTGAFAPPDTYQKALAERRAAEQTPEQDFETGWKADRMRDLAAEHRRLDAHVDARRAETLRAAAGRESYPAPDSYGPDLKKLREKEHR